MSESDGPVPAPEPQYIPPAHVPDALRPRARALRDVTQALQRPGDPQASVAATGATRRGPISIGDAIRAVLALAPRDAAARAAIRSMLGLDEPVEMRAPAGVGVWKPSTEQAIAPGTPRPRTPPPGLPTESDLPAAAPALAGYVLRQERQGSGLPAPPAWALGDEGRLGAAVRTGPLPPPVPLFGPPRGRALLSTTLATMVEEGAVDMKRVIEQLANARVLERLPRLPVLTLRRGVVLLLDRGPGMDPFRADIEQLVRDLDDILSDDRLHVSTFAGTPLRGAGSGPRDGEPWTLRAPGMPVVVVTDLGIGGPVLDHERAPVREWLEFAHRVRDAGSELIGLIPYQATRWPPALARAMTLIHWSERASVGEIRRARREAHARLR